MKRSSVSIMQYTRPFFLPFSSLFVVAWWRINHQSRLLLDAADLSAIAVLRTRYDTFVFRYHSWKCDRSGHVLIKTEGSWLSCVCLFYIDISIFSVCIHYKVIRCPMLLKLNVIKITEFILIMYYNSPMRLRKWTCQFSYTFNNTF